MPPYGFSMGIGTAEVIGWKMRLYCRSLPTARSDDDYDDSDESLIGMPTGDGRWQKAAINERLCLARKVLQ